MLPALPLSLLLLAAPANPTLARLDALYPELDALYEELHRSPELSLQEANTAKKVAARLTRLGYQVTAGVGGHGVVAVLKNGAGPTVMLRADLDGLPVQEQTGLPYASRATATDGAGLKVPVMHACGHDVHMTSLIGAAALLVRAKDQWRGTLLLVAQPAEEVGKGANAMLADGLFTRFPRPDHAVMVHTQGLLPAGAVAIPGGPVFANVDSVDVTLYGKGGHGASPHRAIDPIVLGAQTVMALQTLVSRESNPLDPTVVTVGAFQAGTKHNIIPPDAKLQLTVRSFNNATRARLLAGIERIVNAQATSAGAPKPKVTVDPGPPAHSNDVQLAARARAAMAQVLGEENVLPYDPVLGGEDFAEYGKAGVPALMVWVGTADPKAYAAEKAGGPATLVSTHSPFFAPTKVPTLKTGTATLTALALDLLGKP